jgi:hypothetical protein
MEDFKFRPKTYWTNYCKTWRETVQIQSLGLHLSILTVYQHICSLFTHLLTTSIEQLGETKKAPHNQDFHLMACFKSLPSRVRYEQRSGPTFLLTLR